MKNKNHIMETCPLVDINSIDDTGEPNQVENFLSRHNIPLKKNSKG